MTFLKENTGTLFLLAVILSVCAVSLATGFRVRKRHGEHSRDWELSVMLMPLAMLVLGTACSKFVYAATALQWHQLSSLASPETYSVWGAAAGVCLAVVLCARIDGQKPMAVLDCFAPYGALLLCAARAAEFFLNPALKLRNVTLIGVCDQLNGDSLWHVCFLEAGAALLIAAIAFLRKKHVFVRTVYWLMACQLLTELLHCYSLRLGGLVFVRVEQILCAISMAVILFLHARRTTNGCVFKRYLPLILFLLPVGIIIYAEFELDKGWLNEALWNMFMNPETYEVPAWVESIYYAHSWIWYGVIALCAGFMLLLERIMVRRRADLRSRV